MADFNVKVGEQNPSNFLGFSQGAKVTDAKKTVAQPVSNQTANIINTAAGLFDVGVKTVDSINKANIENQINEKNDLLNQEFGVDSRTTFDVDISDANQPVPSDLQRSGEHLSELRLAVENGTLNQTNYYARLNSIVRQMRTRYPGYRDYIDTVIQRTTGVNPANALRNALFQEAEELKRRSERGKNDLENLEVSLSNKGGLPVDYFQRKNSNEPYSREDLLQRLNVRERQEHNMDITRKQLSLQKDVLELNAAERKDRLLKLEDSAQLSTSFTIDNLLKDTTSGMGRNWSEVNDKLNLLIQAQRNGQNPSPEQVQELKSQAGQLSFQLSNVLEGELNKYRGVLPSEKLDEIRKQQMSRISGYTEALSTGNFALLKHYAENTQLREDMSTNELIANNQEISKFNSLKKVLGDDVASHIFNTSTNISQPILSIALNNKKAEILGEGKPLIEVMRSMVNNPTIDKKVAYSNIIDFTLSSVKDTPLTVDIKKKAIDSFYNVNVSGNFIGDPNLGQEDKRRIFEKGSSKQVADSIKAIADSTGDPRVWNNYKEWVSNSIGILFKPDIDSVNNIQVKFDRIKPVFSKETGELTFKKREGGPNLAQRLTNPLVRLEQNVELFSEMFETGQFSLGQSVLKRLNNATKALKPVYDAEKPGDMSFPEFVLRVLDANGLDLSREHEGSLLRQLREGLEESFTTMAANPKDLTQSP